MVTQSDVTELVLLGVMLLGIGAYRFSRKNPPFLGYFGAGMVDASIVMLIVFGGEWLLNLFYPS